jgi:tRNA(Ile)-lysidine synthase
MELCRGEGLAYVHIPNGVVRRDSGRLWTDYVAEIPMDALLSGDNGEIIFGNFCIVWQNTVMNDEVHNSFNTFLFKYESIKGNVTVTVRRDGDRVKLVGRGCTKKLKQLFLEKKLTQPQRAMTPVLRDEQGIIGVFGFGIAQRCVAEIGDKILKVQVIKKERNGG